MQSHTHLDDLQYKGLRLYQRADLPRFTQDAVLLAAFADLNSRDYAVDLGAGTGALCILCGGRTGAAFTAVEKDAALCELLRQSAAYNGIELPVHELDWADAPRMLGAGRFSAVLCNPPYFAAGTRSPDAARALARSGANAPGGANASGGVNAPGGANASASTDALTGAVFAASRLLKNGGRMYLCYPADRLIDAVCTLRSHRLEPKRLRLVAQQAHSAPYLALVMAKLNAQPGVAVQPTLLLRDANGGESGELRAIYHKED